MRSCVGCKHAVDREHRSITRLSDDEVARLQSEAVEWISKYLCSITHRRVVILTGLLK